MNSTQTVQKQVEGNPRVNMIRRAEYQRIKFLCLVNFVFLAVGIYRLAYLYRSEIDDFEIAKSNLSFLLMVQLGIYLIWVIGSIFSQSELWNKKSEEDFKQKKRKKKCKMQAIVDFLCSSFITIAIFIEIMLLIKLKQKESLKFVPILELGIVNYLVLYTELFETNWIPIYHLFEVLLANLTFIQFSQSEISIRVEISLVSVTLIVLLTYFRRSPIKNFLSTGNFLIGRKNQTLLITSVPENQKSSDKNESQDLKKSIKKKSINYEDLKLIKLGVENIKQGEDYELFKTNRSNQNEENTHLNQNRMMVSEVINNINNTNKNVGKLAFNFQNQAIFQQNLEPISRDNDQQESKEILKKKSNQSKQKRRVIDKLQSQEKLIQINFQENLSDYSFSLKKLTRTDKNQQFKTLANDKQYHIAQPGSSVMSNASEEPDLDSREQEAIQKLENEKENQQQKGEEYFQDDNHSQKQTNPKTKTEDTYDNSAKVNDQQDLPAFREICDILDCGVIVIDLNHDDVVCCNSSILKLLEIQQDQESELVQKLFSLRNYEALKLSTLQVSEFNSQLNVAATAGPPNHPNSLPGVSPGKTHQNFNFNQQINLQESLYEEDKFQRDLVSLEEQIDHRNSISPNGMNSSQPNLFHLEHSLSLDDSQREPNRFRLGSNNRIHHIMQISSKRDMHKTIDLQQSLFISKKESDNLRTIETIFDQILFIKTNMENIETRGTPNQQMRKVSELFVYYNQSLENLSNEVKRTSNGNGNSVMVIGAGGTANESNGSEFSQKSFQETTPASVIQPQSSPKSVIQSNTFALSNIKTNQNGSSSQIMFNSKNVIRSSSTGNFEQIDLQNISVFKVEFYLHQRQRKKVLQETQSFKNESPQLVILLQDITQVQDLKLLEIELQNQDSMLSQVAHEMRTPLSCIISMIQASVSIVQEPIKTQMLSPALTSAKILSSFIHDLLDNAQNDHGQFSLTIQPFDLRQEIEDIVNLMTFQANARQVELSLDYDGPVPRTIQSDSYRIRQILINLVGNALKFTENGKIQIAVTRDFANSMIKVVVVDTGRGIQKEDLSQLFRSFGKLEDKENINSKGVGLGLMISFKLAQKISNNYSGIEVQSDGVGKGTSFIFFIQNFASDTSSPTQKMNNPVSSLTGSSSVGPNNANIQNSFNSSNSNSGNTVSQNTMSQNTNNNNNNNNKISPFLNGNDAAKSFFSSIPEQNEVQMLHFSETLMKSDQSKADKVIVDSESSRILDESMELKIQSTYMHPSSRKHYDVIDGKDECSSPQSNLIKSALLQSFIPRGSHSAIDLGLIFGEDVSLHTQYPPILICDDSYFNCYALEMILDTFNLKSEFVMSGPDSELKILERINIVRQNNSIQIFQIVFMDIEMPGQNGILTVQNIQKIFAENQIPQLTCVLVACTGYSSPEDVKQFMESGFNYYLEKPIDSEQISILIEKIYQDNID